MEKHWKYESPTFLIIFSESPRQSNNFAWDWHPSRYFFVFNNFFYPEVSWKGRGCEGLRVKKQCLLSWWRSGWKQRRWHGGQRRSPVMSHVSVDKDVVRLTFDHACFQSKFRVTVWKDVGRRDQPMNPRNGTKLLGRLRTLSRNSTHSSQTQAKWCS